MTRHVVVRRLPGGRTSIRVELDTVPPDLLEQLPPGPRARVLRELEAAADAIAALLES
jgi:hypothetical protein